MSTRAERYPAQVVARRPLSEHLLRLVLAGPGLAGFRSTGVPDEWVGLVVPGQFQSRYYTVRRWDGAELWLDVVLHEVGLVTEWASRESCVGQTVTVTQPRGSFDPPPAAGWLYLVGDLTALPAMARILESCDLPTRVWAEVTDDLVDYLPSRAEVTWLQPPRPGASTLAEVVAGLDWPDGEGYFWMAGESAQMRAIRRHLLATRRGSAYDVMGYWRASLRKPRQVDPGPVWRAGRAAGKSDAEIWAAYDAAREGPA